MAFRVRKTAQQPPAALPDGEAPSNPNTEFIYDPMGFTGVSVGDDVEKRVNKEFHQVTRQRAGVLLQRHQGVCHYLIRVTLACTC